MKMLKKTRFLIVAAAVVVVSTVLYAAFTFNANTNTQPTITLAPYALSSTDLSGNHVNAYGPWFENGAWQGDLIEYTVCGANDEPLIGCPSGSAGNRFTDAQIGSNPPVAGMINWMARATFAAMEGSNPVSTAYWEEKTDGRHIFTVKSASQVDFLWNKLSPAQKLALDANIADPNDNFNKIPQGTATVATGSAYDSPVLNYIRGDRSQEKSYKGGIFRIRYSLLGDIINSNPVYIGNPIEAYNFDGFPTFKAAISDPSTGRPPRVAVGANDGMLHVFDPTDGSEVYAYIPSMLILDPDATINTNGFPVFVDPVTSNEQLAVSKLNNLHKTPYPHTYFVDGELNAASAYVNGNWKTVLTGGLGAGAKGLFALDVTKAQAVDGTGASIQRVLFEKTGPKFGHIYGAPSIARLADGKWYIVTGNGFGGAELASLLLISLDSPGTVISIPACASGSCTAEADGLATPALLDTNGDYRVDSAYAGDNAGNMWRFNLGDLSNISVTNIYDGSPNQPIMTAPELGFQPNGGYMVYFGTGTIQHTWDPADGVYPKQAIYGIWDRGPGTKIVNQTLDFTEPVFDNTGQTAADGTDCTLPTDPPPDPVRYMNSVQAVDYLCSATDQSTCAKGWGVTLEQGEQVLGSPKLRAGRITVVTRGPGEGDFAGLGESWLMSLDYLTGGDANQIVFNANRDGVLDECDVYGDKPPVGLGFGDGNVSQPILGRIGPGADIMFINGLRLPVVSSPILLGGHLDVETDSPYGGSTAPNSTSSQSEGYNVESNDGLGGAVDGHFHAYDDANHAIDDEGNTVVDLFQLEPQRGKASFIGAPVDTISTSTTDPTTGITTTTISCPDGSVPAGTGCIEAVLPELNRAYDTLTDPATPESEVYGDNASPPTPLAADKEFIVVLANADLSPAATLQIGCTVFSSDSSEKMSTVEYQDEVADILETSSDPIQAMRDKKWVYTLNDIANANNGTCPDGSKPTVRVKFNYRSILDAGVVGTRAQCVLGLHDYRDKVCYSDAEVLSKAPLTYPDLVDTEIQVTDPVTGVTTIEPVTINYDDYSYTSCQDFRFVASPDVPPDGYVRNPERNLHITESLEGQGNKYRWRNGALTVQFISVDSFNAVKDTDYCKAAYYDPDKCPMQDPNTLPRATQGQKKRFGGTYARAFKLEKDGGQYVVTSITPSDGLLYETTMFWHYSDLADELRRADPASIPCYGDSDYNSALSQELGGLTEGEYDALVDAAGTDAIDTFAEKLRLLQQALDSGDEDLIAQRLLELNQLLADADHQELAKYAKYRDYAPGHVPEQHLLPLDKGLISGGGNPAEDVEIKPLLDRSTLGPNLKAGRRSWIDLTD